MNGLEQYKLRYNLPFISAVRAFYKAHENTGLSYHNWNHCLTTALRAEYLYDHTCFPVSHYELNNVFIAGLFHDIGYNKYNKHEDQNIPKDIEQSNYLDDVDLDSEENKE